MCKQLCSLITHSEIPKSPEASLLDMQSLRSHPGLLNHNLHFDKKQMTYLLYIKVTETGFRAFAQNVFLNKHNVLGWNEKYVSTPHTLTIKPNGYLLVIKGQILWKSLCDFLPVIHDRSTFSWGVSENKDVSSLTPCKCLHP